MLYFIMLINSENSLINILIPKDNKVLKEVLKEADLKNLSTENKSSNAHIIKNLFSQLQNKQPNSDLSKILKESTLLKDLGTVSSNIKSLDKLLQDEPKLVKFQTQLKDIFKDIKNLDAKSLKSLLENSGLFLETKLAKQTNANNLSPKVEKILQDISALLSKNSSLETKEIKNIINSLLTNKSSTKESLVKNLDSIKQLLGNIFNKETPSNTKSLVNISNELQKLAKSGTLIESKATNMLDVTKESQKLNIDFKTLLTNLKNELGQSSNNANLLKEINSLLKTDSLFNNNLDKPLKEVLSKLVDLINKNPQISEKLTKVLDLLKENVTSIKVLENKVISNEKINQAPLLSQIKENLNLLKDLTTASNMQNKIQLLSLIDKLTSSKDIFSKVNVSGTSLITNSSSNFNSTVSNVILQLKDFIISNHSDANLNQNEVVKTLDKLQGLLKDENLLNKSNFSKDLKATLLNIQQELNNNNTNQNSELSKSLDKLLTQIDYHQILSLANNSNNIYLPFIWDMLEEGDIELKASKEERFICEINLKLKELGSLNMLLVLYDENKIDLTLHAKKESFKNIFQDNLQELKQALNKVGLIPTNIKILDEKKEPEKETNEDIIPTTVYPKYNKYDNSTFGIDIKV